MNIIIRKAEITEGTALTELTFKSKRYWNYPEEYMKVFEQELIVSEEYIHRNIIYVAEIDGRTGGYYSIKEVKEESWSGKTFVKKGFWLDNLFILPQFIGHGIGRNLLEHAKNTCRNIGCSRLLVFSDPHAKGFYLKQGARFVQDCPSSIEGRTIPMLEIDIA